MICVQTTERRVAFMRRYAHDSHSAERASSLTVSYVHAANVLNRLTAQRGAPTRLFCDNGSEFCGQIVEQRLEGGDIYGEFRVEIVKRPVKI